MIASCAVTDSRLVTDPHEAAVHWRIRADGAGLSRRSPAGLPAHAGWEYAAVPPARLGEYLRDFEALLTAYRLTGLPYGHFGDGCMRICLPAGLLRSQAGGMASAMNCRRPLSTRWAGFDLCRQYVTSAHLSAAPWRAFTWQ